MMEGLQISRGEFAEMALNFATCSGRAGVDVLALSYKVLATVHSQDSAASLQECQDDGYKSKGQDILQGLRGF